MHDEVSTFFNVSGIPKLSDIVYFADQLFFLVEVLMALIYTTHLNPLTNESSVAHLS